jgi:hypothetical protein
MRRREFLKSSAGMGALAGSGYTGGLGMDSAKEEVKQGPAKGGSDSGKVGRPVRVVSICTKGNDRPLESTVQLVDSQGARGADVITLGEG